MAISFTNHSGNPVMRQVSKMAKRFKIKLLKHSVLLAKGLALLMHRVHTNFLINLQVLLRIKGLH